MGCDIHGVVQTRWQGETQWYSALPIEDGRNYAVFAALADVRSYGEIVPIDRPRGLPGDFREDGLSLPLFPYKGMKVWMGDHSFSWFILRELIEWSGWDQVVNGVSLRSLCDTFLKWLDYLDSKYDREEVRIVVGFDS